MELNIVMTILDRVRVDTLESIIKSLSLPMTITMLAEGTATSEHLSLWGLLPTEKAIVSTIADGEQTLRLIKAVKRRMFIDIPGNGIMMSVPIKSVGGGRTMAYLTDNKTPAGSQPSTEFPYELIYVIVNEGFSDMVMHAARSKGASGGTIIQGRGTGINPAGKFLGISLANEKDIVMILVEASKKNAVMKAIMEEAGAKTPAGSICFSLPVTQVAGLRDVDTED